MEKSMTAPAKLSWNEQKTKLKAKFSYKDAKGRKARLSRGSKRNENAYKF